MMSTHRMEIAHESGVGHIRRYVQETALRLGACPSRAAEAAIVATELATNTIKYGRGGEILLREIKEEQGGSLELFAVDSGPGMASVSACMRDGYSTGGSSGTGLGAVQRLSTQFQIQSQPGKGTVAWASLSLTGNDAPVRNLLWGGISVALKGEELCGDAWDIQYHENHWRVLVADGLGHGPFAQVAAREAVSVFRKKPSAGPSDCLALIHLALGKTRGAAASIVEIPQEGRQLQAAGIGNVSMRLQAAHGMKTLGCDNGTLGGAYYRVNQQQVPIESGALLVMHSDGLGSQWNLEGYPGLSRRHPSLIAGVLYRDYQRPQDDSTVVVIRLPA